ncbi:hypothetical protein B5K11_19995 [Rhizobium leguminosarum bv. trifolii]|uniref:hypothetical protein n=1 Tax=Rhizobium leguminosarum TaxID=384 RepID=UPI000E2E62F3|nr:hypothetical protein [Rhizobium leguminosarum]RFB90338.1 hypothetical protein B5K11_19995 [Rhizobium leguminosarum bv. trifolii]
MNDNQVKHIFANIAPLHETSFGKVVKGRVIGWKRSHNGSLGAIIVFPNSDRPGKHLYIVNPANWFQLLFERTLH